MSRRVPPSGSKGFSTTPSSVEFRVSNTQKTRSSFSTMMTFAGSRSSQQSSSVRRLRMPYRLKMAIRRSKGKFAFLILMCFIKKSSLLCKTPIGGIVTNKNSISQKRNYVKKKYNFMIFI